MRLGSSTSYVLKTNLRLSHQILMKKKGAAGLNYISAIEPGFDCHPVYGTKATLNLSFAQVRVKKNVCFLIVYRGRKKRFVIVSKKIFK